jgi:hypothetical protein
MPEYVFLNKSNDTIYYSAIATTEQEAKEEWARKTGCDDWAELEARLRKGENDIAVAVVQSSGEPKQSQKTKDIFYITQFRHSNSWEIFTTDGSKHDINWRGGNNLASYKQSTWRYTTLTFDELPKEVQDCFLLHA